MNGIPLFLRRATIIIVAILLVVGGVGAQDNPKVLRLAFTTEPGVLTDYFDDSGISFWMMHIYLRPNWGLGKDAQPVAALVDELPSVENGGIINDLDAGKTTVKFRIADWAVWSDGTPITAADFILPFDIRYDGISTMLPGRFANGADVESVTQGETEKDVVITFPGTNPDWVVAAQWVPLPNHILREPYEAALAEGKGFDTLTDWLRSPSVGNGPYVFSEWESGSYLKFVRNEHYWKPVWGDELIVNFFADTNVIKQLLINDQLDWTSSVPLREARETADANDNLKLSTMYSGGRTELRFNIGPNGNPALKDVRVRQAIAMGIDRQYIVDELFDGTTKVPRSYWDDTPWYDENTPYIAYDPEGALALLREAGWYDEDGDGKPEAHGVEGVEDGTPLTLTASTYAGNAFVEYQDTLLAVQDMLKDIGIDVSITLYEPGIMHASLTDGGPYANGMQDLYLQGWGVGIMTINQLQLWDCASVPTEQNPNGWNGIHACYPEMDALWNTVATSLDENERQAAANKIQEFMANEVFTLFMVNTYYPTMLMNINLENVVLVDTPTPWYTLDQWMRSDY